MLEDLKNKLPGLKEDEPLSNHTTFRIGGPARYFYVAKNRGELLMAIKAAEELNLPYFILGWGSNILVSDQGFSGLVIKSTSEIFKVKGQEIYAEAGLNLSRLVGAATQASLTNLEFMAGVPGTVGGAAAGNAGALGRSFGEIVKELEIYQGGKVRIISQADAKYSYRQSIFKHGESGVIISATIKLKKGKQKEIQSKVVEIIAGRKKLPYEPSAGCVFKNIDLKNIEIDRERVIKALDINQAEWVKATAHGKLPVGFIIDKLGLKGKKIGGCVISDKHSAFFINAGQAKAEHVLMLISDIKMRVRNQLGIQLEEEIRLLGF